jgi:lipopolysaccharide/colanic/teichoic acid biosynthesis glycosyltransferase
LILRLFGTRTIAASWDIAIGTTATLAVLGPAAIFGVYDRTVTCAWDRLRIRFYVAATLPWTSTAFLAVMQPLRIGSVQILVITAAVYLPFSMLADAFVRRLLFCWLDWGANVLVVGSGALAQSVVQVLCAKPELGLRPIGYCGEITDNRTLRQLPHLGSICDAAKLSGVADVALIALSGEQSVVDLSHLPFDRIVLLPGIEYLPATRTRPCALGWIAAREYVNPRRALSYHHIKRVLDLLVAIPLLLFCLPLIFSVGLAIWCISPGPIFYAQRRVGWQCRPLTIFKLRSMWPNASAKLELLLQTNSLARQEWQTYAKLRSDPRVLPIIGSFIRRTSIDELPQLWNVIRGDMSLVGPRPFPAYHVERFSPDFQVLRSSVRPGLTGLWQVTLRSGADLRQQECIDRYYIRSESLWLDLYIILLTIPAVLSTRGAR